MKKILSFVLMTVALGCMNLMAQTTLSYTLDASTNGTTITVPGNAHVQLLDDGGIAGTYGTGYDYHVTIKIECENIVDSNATGDPNDTRIAALNLNIPAEDIDCQDMLYVYDGPSITSPLLVQRNNCTASSNVEMLYVTPTNATGEFTIRFVSAVRDNLDTNSHHNGFQLEISCAKPCELAIPILDSVFIRTDLRTGEQIALGKMRDVPSNIDTTFYTYYVPIHDSLGDRYDTIVTDSIISIDTTAFVLGALLCQGQGVTFRAHGQYTNNTGYYTPTDATTRFMWTFSPSDTLFRNGATVAPTSVFQNTECYDCSLYLVDMHGCKSPIVEWQVRVAQNPIKTIFDLDAICNDDSLLVNVGYDGDNGTLTLKKITFASTFSQVNNVRQFIPDGPACPIACFETPVEFNEFQPGQKVRSASEICSICINYEHTYMGDYRIAISCPTYNPSVSQTAGYAVLKYGKYGTDRTCDPLATAESPDGTMAGGSDNTGWPNSTSHLCDSLDNPYGTGMDYCWSRNGKYTYVQGSRGDDPVDDLRMFISNTQNTYSGIATFPTTPTYFNVQAGQTQPDQNMTTRTPSNHDQKTDYYRPASDFSELVGCPLNGTWNAIICDFWSGDNGWVFGWTMDLCGEQPAGGCNYQVGIDSVLWLPDTNRITHPEDFRDGYYHGLVINSKAGDVTSSYISSPDTAGDFRIKLSIFDEFGCEWDTITHITSVYTPLPNLGNDTVLCGVNTTTLDAIDKYTNSPLANYSYLWEPYGQTTRTVETEANTGHDLRYIVEVRNDLNQKTCVARDTIVVAVKPQPVLNFDPGMYPLEGCEPLTINFTNTTTDGYKYRWVFGDGTYSTLMNPSHTYGAGTYDLKYYVESEGGCKDSLIFDDLISVFPQPHAAFSWEPTFPTVLHPTIALSNNTTPDDGSNSYFWEIQFDKNNPYTVETYRDRNPTYTWTAPAGEDVSGNYNVRLIARSDNYGLSGHLTQCADTIENTILIINDNLQFPNVVTPNGDGLNDRFVIKNLVEGRAFPINQLEIFDKWGSRVFHAENISKDEEFWDPARSNTPAGTYFYRFSGKGYKGNIEHNGVIEILK